MKVKKLKGENVYLGPVSKKDIPRLVKWMNDIEVLKYIAQIYSSHTEETVEEYLEKCNKSPTKHYYGIFLNNGELIGGTDLTHIDQINQIASLGIIIGEKQHWSKGYGTEAIKLLLDYGFNILNLNNIMLEVVDFNKRAQRCYEKVGFKIIGKRRKCTFLAGKYYDHIFMDILAEDFKDSKIKKILN
jgi:RimJ/RimL family protein N-acetyltransferase